ncbi:hypothetical protein ACVWXP_003756 [Bradyrhizobium sp. USDA 4463]
MKPISIVWQPSWLPSRMPSRQQSVSAQAWGAVLKMFWRAAVNLGNGDDEYLHRDPLESGHQDLFDVEIANGPKQLKSERAENRYCSLRVLEGGGAEPFPGLPASVGSRRTPIGRTAVRAATERD